MMSATTNLDPGTRYTLTYPATPGAIPTRQWSGATIREARREAVACRARRDLRYQDVRIDRADGRLAEYAGPVR